MADEVREVVEGEGYAAANIDGMGEGPGFRKIRHAIGVTAFGINAIVLPPGIETGFHFHDEQEETYFVHRGKVEFLFGDGGKVVLGPGGTVRVDAKTHRKVKSIGDEDAVLVIAGGKDGYVGRDGRLPDGEHIGARPSGAPSP